MEGDIYHIHTCLCFRFHKYKYALTYFLNLHTSPPLFLQNIPSLLNINMLLTVQPEFNVSS